MQIPALQPARDTGKQLVHTVRKTLNWNDPLIAAPRDPFAALPQNAFISRLVCEVVTAFTGTTPALSIGTTTANANEIMSGTDTGAATVGVKSTITTGLGRSLTTGGTTYLYAKLAAAGATAGQAIVIIEFVPNTDG
jgi:hypothetical protein